MARSGDDANGLRESPVRSVSVDRDATVVALAGELDLYNADEVRSALHEAADRAPQRLVLDLGAVAFVDSTALGVFIEVRRRLPNQDAFLLAAPARDVRRILEVSGLDRHFALYDSVAAALAAHV